MTVVCLKCSTKFIARVSAKKIICPGCGYTIDLAEIDLADLAIMKGESNHASKNQSQAP